MEYYVYAYLDRTEILNKEYCGVYFEYRPIYIGKGKNNRIKEHLNSRKRFKTMFYNKLNKMINEGNFPILIELKRFENECDALDFEMFLISEIKSIKNNGLLYNLTDGGKGALGYKFTDFQKDKMRQYSIENKIHLYFPENKGVNHPMYGKKHTIESKEKMSKSRTGKKQTDEWVENRASKLRGVPLSEDHKRKLSEANKNKFVSEDTKRKISESKMGLDPWNKGLMKDTILQITLDGDIIKEWDSLIELEKDGYQKSNIINVCLGKRKSHKGFKWSYKEDYYLSNN